MGFQVSSIYSGLGVFETILYKKGELKHLYFHNERLQGALFYFFNKRVSSFFIEEILELYHADLAVYEEARVKIIVYCSQEGQLQHEVQIASYVPSLGCANLSISNFTPSPHRPTVGYKCISYADYYLAHKQAVDSGRDEAILFNTEGYLCEGAITNIFFYKQEKLYTPSIDSGCLPGVMRRVVMQKALEHNIQVEEGLFNKEFFFSAESIFITNALKGIQPVFQVESKAFKLLPESVLDLLNHA